MQTFNQHAAKAGAQETHSNTEPRKMCSRHVRFITICHLTLGLSFSQRCCVSSSAARDTAAPDLSVFTVGGLLLDQHSQVRSLFAHPWPE